MKPALIWISAIAVTSIAGVTLWTLQADDKKKEASGEAKDATPKDPSIVFQSGFEDQKAGPTPSDYFVVDGEWSIADLDVGKVLKLAEEPLVDGQVQLGESLKEAGGTIVAKVKTEKKRRSFPRFGVGLHGMSGFRLRLVPVQNKIELVRNEEVVASADLTWQSGQW
ncbi:MAG: hypothetical protein KDL87_07655, partial [Verrucomicrobiae bacterium]|nr:hypothetical protein [Verrucomicrobiae bacterium]